MDHPRNIMTSAKKSWTFCSICMTMIGDWGWSGGPYHKMGSIQPCDKHVTWECILCGLAWLLTMFICLHVKFSSLLLIHIKASWLCFFSRNMTSCVKVIVIPSMHILCSIGTRWMFFCGYDVLWLDPGDYTKLCWVMNNNIQQVRVRHRSMDYRWVRKNLFW